MSCVCVWTLTVRRWTPNVFNGVYALDCNGVYALECTGRFDLTVANTEASGIDRTGELLNGVDVVNTLVRGELVFRLLVCTVTHPHRVRQSKIYFHQPLPTSRGPGVIECVSIACGAQKLTYLHTCTHSFIHSSRRSENGSTCPVLWSRGALTKCRGKWESKRETVWYLRCTLPKRRI